MLSAGGSLRWLRDAVAPRASYESLVAGAAQVPPGSDGLLFLPYLTGERTPHPDARARGAFVGLTIRHDLRHMTRSILEGVAFGLRDGLDLMTAAGVADPSQIRASGGGIRSGLWRQILADVLRAEIATVATEEGAAMGAALLAAVGVGWFDSVEAACLAAVEAKPVARPTDLTDAYRAIHQRYDALYPALAPTFHSA
jgi:xylulokinase